MNLTDPVCLDNIKACATASQLAYTQPTLTDPISGESLLIQDLSDCTLIAFPGRHDLRDVLRDIDCLRITTVILGQPCAVHAGFNRTHNALFKKISLAYSIKETVTIPPTVAVTPSPLNGESAGGRGENTQGGPPHPHLLHRPFQRRSRCPPLRPRAARKKFTRRRTHHFRRTARRRRPLRHHLQSRPRRRLAPPHQRRRP